MLNSARPAGISNSIASTPVWCPACGCHGPESIVLRLTWGSFHQCPSCETWSVSPRPTNAEQIALHDDATYFEHEYFGIRRSEQQRIDARCRDIFQRLADRPSNGFRGQRLLDVGCDTGGFMEAAARLFGVVPKGIDVSKIAAKVAASRGLDVSCDTIESLRPVVPFDLVTAIDVIEHVAEPDKFLEGIATHLKVGGRFYAETPNLGSVIYSIGTLLHHARVPGTSPLVDRLYPPQHIQYFSDGGLRSALNKAGLQIVSIGRRRLTGHDLAAPGPIRLGLQALQTIDQVLGREILTWVVARRTP
jgi:SAM-dependent methyltransferase